MLNHPVQARYLLWSLLALFFLRVLGQIIVVLFSPRWLPPISQWYSGLLPYRLLLPIQIALLFVMGMVCRDVMRGEGFFAVPRSRLGQGLVWFSYIYFSSMVARYVIQMTLRPDQRWFGGTIPILFHCVLAAFLFVLGSYYVKRLSRRTNKLAD